MNKNKKVYKYEFAQLMQLEMAKLEKEFSYQDCIDFINVYQDLILKLLVDKVDISFVKFGVFSTWESTKKCYSNKHRKKPIEIQDVIQTKFKFSTVFRQKLKEKRKK